MGWFKKTFITKTSFEALSEYNGDSFISGIVSSSGVSRRRLLNEYKELVYACINVISEEVGKYEPYFYHLVNGQQVVDTQHPFLALLERPNPHQTQFQLFEATQSFIEITGEAFWVVTYGQGGRTPVRLDLVRPDKVEVALQDKKDPSGRIAVGDVIGYAIMGSEGTPVPFTVDEVIHFKTFNPVNPYRGYSTLEAGLTSIGVDTATTEFQKRFMDNNATPQSIVSFKGNIGKEAFEKVKRIFSERHAGVANAGKTLFIRDTDIDIKQLGLSLADLDLKDLKTITSERVRGMFRVPMPLLGNTDGIGLGRAGVESEEYIFQKYPIEAKKKRLDDQLKIACRKFWPNQGNILVGHKTNIPDDGELVLKEHSELTGKVITINEARKQRGLLPVEGGDELYVSFNVVRVGKDDENPNDDKENRPPKEEPVEGQDPNNGDIPEQFKIVKRKIVKAKSPEETLFDNAENITEQGIKEYTQKIEKLLITQRDQIISQYELLSGKAIEQQILPNEESESEKFAAAVILLMYLYLQRGGELGLGFAGGTGTEFVLDRLTQELMSSSTTKVFKDFTKETLKEIRDIVKATLDQSAVEGLTVEQTRKRVIKNIKDIYSDATTARLERLADSEIHRAINNGLLRGYEQAGVQYVQWKANPGACEFCAELHGTIKKTGELFVPFGGSVSGANGGTYKNNYEDIKNAHLHPYCRCLLIPVYSDSPPVKELVRVEVPVEIETVETEELRKALLEQKDYVRALEEIAGVEDDGHDTEG